MAREKMTVTADTLDEAWEKAKRRFVRKFHTRKMYVAITGVERIGDVHALEGHGSAGGQLQQVETAQKGGLAGAGRPDDHHHFAAMDIRGDAIFRPSLALTNS